MAYVDFMANQSDASSIIYPSHSTTTTPSLLLPAMHPNSMATYCSNCYTQCDMNLTYHGLCFNCQNRLMPNNDAAHDALCDSLIMSNMLNVVNDVLDDEDKLVTPTCSDCGLLQSQSNPMTQCPDCQVMLCVTCIFQHSHNKTLSPTTIINTSNSKLHEMSPNARSSKSPVPSAVRNGSLNDDDDPQSLYCETHAGECIRYFCEPCKALLCFRCISSSSHKHHRYITIPEAYSHVSNSLDSVLNEAMQRMQQLSLSVDSANEMKDKIVMKQDEAIERVRKFFQSYREAILKQEKNAIDEIVRLAQLKVKSLMNEKENNKKTLKNLGQCITDVKSNGKKATTILSFHTIQKQLLDPMPSSVPIEDSSFILKTATNKDSLRSLCIVTTTPYPGLCTAMGEGLIHPRVNRLATVLVNTKDRMGEPINEGGEQVSASLTSSSGSPLKVDVHDNNDGSYAINFQPKTKGDHHLSIMIKGHHIKGSPFKLDVDGGRDYGLYGAVTNIFGVEGNGPGQFCRPWGITSDQKGNIIIGDRSNHRIQVFNSNGVFKTMFGCEGSAPGQFNRPAGVAVTREGNVVVADKDNHRIQVLKIDGTFIFKFGCRGGNDGQMIYPYDVAVNQVDGRIAVTDTGNHRLLIFSNEGALLGKFGYKGYLCGHFDSPRGIAFNNEGHIIVSDFNVHHILIIHPDGTTARILGSQGTGNGQFLRPQGIAVDHAGNFVIADTRNNRVVVMHPSGHFVVKFGTPGSGQGQLDRPTSVCTLPDRRIAVLDFGNSRVQIF